VPRSESLKPFQVVRQPVDKFIVQADGPVFGNSCNDVDIHRFVLYYLIRVAKVQIFFFIS
jgi:hypothetical protein